MLLPALARSVSILLIAASCLPAQTAQRSLRGTVLDPQRGALSGARVTVLPAGPTVLSGPAGEFSIALKPGPYELRVEHDGFSQTTVATDGAQPLEVILELPPVLTTVSVAETAYITLATNSATRTQTLLRDVPQSISVVPREQMRDQMMTSIADVVRYVPGITAHQGENNRDQLVVRGNSTSADFFVNGMRDDVQYFRDLYNLERVEALKGPNAMIFGRGGAGGVVNRVTKEAGYAPLREITVQGGSFGNRRFTADLDQPLGERFAVRLNGMYENSDSFRRFVNLERYGISPAISWLPSDRTKVTASFERFDDHRTSDRGITSWRGRPLDLDPGAYFGNPDQSWVRSAVHLGAAAIEHQAGRFNLRSRFQVGDYDRGYQNFVPGAVTADGQRAALSGYNNLTHRLNLFEQTDVTYAATTWKLRHTLLGGVEAGRQSTANFRNTGYFGAATATSVPLADPVLRTPATFRQSATDADNHVTANLGAVYVQDQVEITRWLQAIVGLRWDRFDLTYRNNRDGSRLRRVDPLLSPRAGIVLKPAATVSLYGSYSVSHLPSSGDQFSSLTTVTQQVKPEDFRNLEVGVKWDAARRLSLTAAAYRLDRTNTRSTDPNDPTRIVQTGGQRSNGFEAGVSGNLTSKWRAAGGYAWQDAFVTSATVAARPGAQVAQAPHHTFSLWNHYQPVRRLGLGLGLLNRSDMFAAIDNSVALPGYFRADAAVFYAVTEKLRLQVNAENLTGRRYFANADNNTNISPGSPRAVRAGLAVRF